jgi:hypothetical protein
MLSRAGLKARFFKNITAARRNFSTELVNAQASTQKNEFMTVFDLSKQSVEFQKKHEHETKDYLDMLNDTAARQRFFTNLARESSADHGEISKVKHQINELIHQEIHLAEF